MAKYIKQEMPNMNGTEEPQVYYRLKTNRNISSKEFIQLISRNGSATDRGEIEGILIRIADGLAILWNRLFVCQTTENFKQSFHFLTLAGVSFPVFLL